MQTISEQQLIDRHILEDPDSPGPLDARLRDSYIHVWAVVGYLHVYEGDVHAVAQTYELPDEPIKAALAYYRRHAAALDARLAANGS